MLNELELKKASNYYNLNYKILPDNNSFLTKHMGDEWLVEYNSHTKKYELYHKNKVCNKTSKFHFHPQRTFYDIWYMFRYIIQHKNQYKKYSKLYRMNELYKKINKNSQ